MFSIKYAPSLYPGMTLRKHPNVHNTKGSKMSFKEILKKKSNLKLYRSLVRRSSCFFLLSSYFIEALMIMAMIYAQADFHVFSFIAD